MMSPEITDLAGLRAHRGFARLLDYVAEKRGLSRWASRAAIDPVDIPTLLPHLWLIEIVRDSGKPRLLVRLAGTRVESVYDRRLAGIWLEDLDWGENSARIFASLYGMAESGRGHFLDASARIKPRLARRVMRLGLPLAEAEAKPTHLLMLALYEFARGDQRSIGPDYFREFWLDTAAAADDAGRGGTAALNENPMKLLYFAWIRTKIGMAEDIVTPPAEVARVGDLLDWLEQRGANFAAALKERSIVKVAVNQEYVGLDHPLKPQDEVALFPPVTGG